MYFIKADTVLLLSFKVYVLSCTLFAADNPSVKQSRASAVPFNGKSEHSTKGTWCPINGCLFAIAYSFLHNSFSSISHSSRHILRSLRFISFLLDCVSSRLTVFFLFDFLSSLGMKSKPEPNVGLRFFLFSPMPSSVSSGSLSSKKSPGFELRRLKYCLLASVFFFFSLLGASRHIGNAE